MNTMNFTDYLDYRFTISGEMISGKGEDSYCSAVSETSALAAVFDGCGGLGSREYEGLSERTGAYMASRAAAGAVYDWYMDTDGAVNVSAEAVGEELREYMDKALGICEQYSGETSLLSGSMVRDFPSTAAIALTSLTQEGIDLQCFWAGDSRIYLLDPEGLVQLSVDDIGGGLDAMENLSHDAALTNVLSSDKEYVLRQRSILLKDPCMIMTATDGCFGYLLSPMHFEYMILSSLLESDKPCAFEKKLEQNIRDVAGDDYALSFLSFGFGDFKGMQKAMRARRAYLETTYIRPIEEEGAPAAEELWQDYREQYERLIRRN